VIVVKKIGFPGQLEFAAGAMAEDGEALLNADVIAPYCYDPYFMHDLRYQIARTRAQIAYQISEFRQGRRLHLSNATIILVDDGIATGETVKAAVHWLRAQPASNFPESIIVAAPVCSPNTAADLRLLADEVICVAFPNNFRAVGQFYQRFDQTSDDEVKRILAEQRQKA
jgi:predicted phosphoribosyltransferase